MFVIRNLETKMTYSGEIETAHSYNILFLYWWWTEKASETSIIAFLVAESMTIHKI